MLHICARTCLPATLGHDEMAHCNTFNTLPHFATHCNTLQHTLGWSHRRASISHPPCVAVCCSCCVLRCAAVCCSVLQCVPYRVLHCVALCCSVLQCVAVLLSYCRERDTPSEAAVSLRAVDTLWHSWALENRVFYCSLELVLQGFFC